MRKCCITLFLVAALAGCDLFSTRAPNPPDSSNTFIWTPATSVDYLLNNFTGTLQLIDPSNHARAFISERDSVVVGGAKTYQFTPSPRLDQSSRSLFTSWSVESEKAYVTKLRSLLPKNSQLTVLLSNRVIDQSSNTANVTSDYSISIPVDSSSTVIPSLILGSLQMQLQLVTTEQSTKEWRIVSWSDFPTKVKTQPCWSDLKIKLSS